MAQIISQKQLVRLFKDTKDNTKSDLRFCFLLGAGASRSSGIKTGAEMAKLWYGNIKEDLTADELETWKKSIGLDEERVADFYPKVFEKRFIERRAGYEFLQCEMDKAEPSLGYAVLAQVLEETKHNFVITTNFDYLIEDALQTFTHTHPLVCGHESLASFVYTHSERPTIMKVHRDLFLDPFNDGDNVSHLKKEWIEALKPIVSNFHIVVLGYGGNDGSLMDYLTAIPAENRKAIYWCVRDPKSLNEKITQLLGVNDKIVQIKGFDELMYELHSVYEFETYIDGNDLEKSKIVEVARERAKRFKAKIDELGKSVSERRKVGDDVSEAEIEMLPHWWDYQLKADAESDPEKQDKIYHTCMKAFPSESAIVGNYANFLKDVRENYEGAEKYYKRALEMDPNHANYNGNYALFLHTVRKDYKEAAIYYKRALEIDPNHANNNLNYAIFLHTVRKDYDGAEKYYKRAVAIDPNDADLNGSCATFLHTVRKDYDGAEKYYKRAFEINPNHANLNGNYAGFILEQGMRKEALFYLEKAFDSAVNNDLKLELNFYLMAHYPEKYEETKHEIEQLLAQGAQSIGWDFSKNISRAELDGCEYIDELKELAERITGKKH